MRCDRYRQTLRRLLAAALIAALAGGCAPLQERRLPASAPAPAPVADADPVVDLLFYAAGLRKTGPAQRAAGVVAARRAVKMHPDAQSYAQLAIAFGTPNQRRYTPDEAARYARLALNADDAAWSPAARQYLYDYERLYTGLTDDRASQRKAQSESPADAADDRNPSETAKQSQQRRIQQLRAALQAARRKLHKLVDIEDRLGETQP